MRPTTDVLHVTEEAASALASAQYRVRRATDAASASDVLESEPVDVVVHDLAGTAASLDALATVTDATDVPVLARSPEPDGELASAATARGADGYCTHADDLPARVDALVESHGDQAVDAVQAVDADQSHANQSADADAAQAADVVDDRHWYRRLYEAASEPAGDFTETVERLLAVGCERLDLAYGFLTRFDDDAQRVTVAVGDHSGLQAGASAPLSESYCQYTAGTDDGYLALEDAARQLGDADALDRFELGCYVGGVVSLDGETYGSLCFADDPARDVAFDDADRTFVEFTVELAEHELERRQAQDEIEVARERYERVLERIDDAFLALDDDWRLTYVNRRAADLLDRDREALLGEVVWEQFPSDATASFRDAYERAMADQEPVTFEERFDQLDGWFEVRAYPSTDGLSVFFRDVTDRKRRETQLTDLLDGVRDLYGETDRERIAQRVVDATQDVLGYDYVSVRLHDAEADTLPPTAISDALERDAPDRPTYDADEGGAGEAFQTGTIVERERYLPDVHGPLTNARYYPVGDHGVITVAARYDDPALTTTDRRLAEILAANTAAALDLADRQRALERYETVLENVQDMVFVLDDAGVVEYVTDPVARAVGRARGAIRGRHASDFVDADAATVNELVRALVDGDQARTTIQLGLQTQDGTLPIEIDAAVLPGTDRRGVVGVVHDISDLTETRARLETENARFRQLFQSLPDPVVENRFVDGEPIVERVNPAFEDVFGYDAEAVLGRSINDLIVPDDELAEARELDATATTATAAEPTVLSRELVRETETGSRHFLFRGISYVDGDVRRGYGIYTDITAQRDRERRLQVLNTVLRHNLRTEMTLVAGYAEELAARHGDDAAVERILDAVDEVVALSDKARDLEDALGDPADRRFVDVADVAAAAVAEVTEGAPDRSVTLEARSAFVVADHRLELVFENLLENAFEHGTGEVAVDVTPTEDEVHVHVDDDGDGVPVVERELLTGERDITQLEHGSGLGLWVASWLLDAFDGYLEFDADSTVVAVLPRARDVADHVTGHVPGVDGGED